MFTPTYIARRIGDEYVMVRVDSDAVLRRAAVTGLGVGLIGYGLLRKGLPGIAACAVGSLLAYAGWTGRNPLREALSHSAVPANPRAGVEDSVDEASFESFPASDPPGSTHNDPVRP